MRTPPPGVDRHFAGAPLDLDDPGGRALAVERLLEDGDRADLAWLAAEVPPAAIADWFARRGARRLSRRSRALWAAALGLPNPPAAPAAAALWPLA
jgi:hypothetical protein